MYLVTKVLETDFDFDKLLFVFNNIKVKKIADDKIEISLTEEVYCFASNNDAEGFIRADLFMILGILSFITKHYYDIFGFKGVSFSTIVLSSCTKQKSLRIIGSLMKDRFYDLDSKKST